MATRHADPYATLQVAPHADSQQIRRAWLKLSKQHHPDRFPSDAQKSQATSRLQQINAAYEQLSDPHQRQRVDQQRSTALAHRPESRPVSQASANNVAVAGFSNRNLPHRYTPGNKYVVFDGITYMNLAEAGRRIKQPVDRLKMYVQNGELNAFEFDNQQWVTEASLIPLRTRHKSMRSIADNPRSSYKAVVPHLGRPARQLTGGRIGPRTSGSAGHQYDAPRIDEKAHVVLSIAPTVFLAIVGTLLYCYLANFANVWPQIARLPQALGL